MPYFFCTHDMLPFLIWKKKWWVFFKIPYFCFEM